MTTSSPKPNIFALIAAFAAILVVGMGKTLHFHQECGDCCKNHDQVNSAEEIEAIPCPFGCSHHSAPTNSEQDGSEPEQHNEHDCPICQILGQPTSAPLILGLPEVTENRLIVLSLSSDSPEQGVETAYESRGPPIVA